jgi:LAS superfamily LD-carboxypeptidase LdcB
MKYPVKVFRIPDELKPYPNGRIPEKYLRSTEKIGQLYHLAAWWAGVMITEAAKDGIKLYRISEGYRPYKRQYSLFMERYSTKDLGRSPKVTRVWNQQTWYLKPGYAPCASPGYSPHGWGCAQDWAVDKPEVLEWLRKNAPRYGFYWEGQPTLPNGKANPEWEPWHLNWIG